MLYLNNSWPTIAVMHSGLLLFLVFIRVRTFHAATQQAHNVEIAFHLGLEIDSTFIQHCVPVENLHSFLCFSAISSLVIVALLSTG
jgi:hypothetical protein